MSADLTRAIPPREWDAAVWTWDGNAIAGCIDVADRKRLVDLIEAVVREQVAREIESKAAFLDTSSYWRDGMDDAARIARGES